MLGASPARRQKACSVLGSSPRSVTLASTLALLCERRCTALRTHTHCLSTGLALFCERGCIVFQTGLAFLFDRSGISFRVRLQFIASAGRTRVSLRVTHIVFDLELPCCISEPCFIITITIVGIIFREEMIGKYEDTRHELQTDGIHGCRCICVCILHRPSQEYLYARFKRRTYHGRPHAFCVTRGLIELDHDHGCTNISSHYGVSVR